MDKFNLVSINNISKLPETAGVYAFYQGGQLLYIGKAINIKERVKQHEKLLSLAEQLGYIKTESEIEALILEANLIKKYRPKYNTVWKDDKNYFYVVATKENFPKISITHQPKSERGLTSFIGPFVDGGALKETLKILRKVFPYRTCHRLPRHACLWYQLKRCPAPCLSKSSLAQQIVGFTKSNMRECQKNAENLITTLKQGKNAILKKLTREMRALSRDQQFEQASHIRDQIKSLEKVMSNAQILGSGELRAEAYDIANIQGREATGAMVVFIDGKPDKSQYRQFKIKGEQKPNDIAMLKEVLERRFNHPEWPYPDLILIDGGKAQLNAAIEIRNSKHEVRRKFGFRVMSLAKRNNELYIEGKNQPVLLKTLPRETFNLILQLRDEAHRFARRYHHKLRKRALLG